MSVLSLLFFFNDTSTTEIYTLSLHDALPIFALRPVLRAPLHAHRPHAHARHPVAPPLTRTGSRPRPPPRDRKSTRLNSSHANISYAGFCLKNRGPTSRSPLRLPAAGRPARLS